MGRSTLGRARRVSQEAGTARKKALGQEGRGVFGETTERCVVRGKEGGFNLEF